MELLIQNYIQNINTRYQTGISREHSYRGDLQDLLSKLAPDVLVTNEPARVSCGAPDYIITKNDIPVGYIEAKDIGKELDDKSYKEQFNRYRSSLNNLIITDYLNFWLYIDGELATKVKIAEIQNGNIVAIQENFNQFNNLIKDFCTHKAQTIKSPSKLSKMMACKARMLADVLEKALTNDEQNQEDTTLREQMEAFKKVLIHDITPKGFADVYAQTIAYGLFAARFHDPTLPTFSRQEAAELIPKSNPFLRKLFQYIAGYDLDDRIKWIIESLIEVFLAADVATILDDFGKATRMQDPIIHFYETFLTEYDPQLRKSRGVWYTPQPVVNFIVRAVDDILKSEFNLEQGLADTSKTTIKLKSQTADNRTKTGYKEVDEECHKVQILDPATGTGTFLTEIVKHIYKKFESQKGIWSNYVENNLIPRLNGFELLMASYSMAHLKLDMLLQETGFKPTKDQRFKIYLTNSLEEHHPDTGTLFSTWLSNEANEANHIKRDTPVMVVLGNPPYSGESANKGDWIMNLMDDYKKEPGGKEKLKERNPKWINDDYVKFLRYGQHFIEKNGEGILAFINPHGFLDNPTFRGMRWNLLKTYDKIYTIDLHGNAKKKETCPDDSIDQNVFDIMQGVSINIFVKTGKKKANQLGEIFNYDLYGKRDDKYNFLIENNLKSINFTKLEPTEPNYFFVKKDFEVQKRYDKGFLLTDCFPLNSVGIVTSRDELTINLSKTNLWDKVNFFINNPEAVVRNELKLPNDVRDWKFEWAKKDLISSELDKNKIKQISYRPFDNRYIYYTGNSRGFICYPRDNVMQHLIKNENLGLSLCRQFKSGNQYQHALISNKIIESSYVSNKTSEITSIFPLYLYPENSNQQSLEKVQKRTPNLNQEIVKIIADKIDLTFTNEKEETKNTFAPIDILDYIYAVLHSPKYRKKYKEFLKIDFPRVPYPKDTTIFWQLVKLGGKLRQLHLLESPKVSQLITTYPIDGNNTITRKLSKTSIGWETTDKEKQIGKVWINDEQYFDNVPLVAWEFYIGGYQPAQKWLKDRYNRELSFDDILHYQKIIVSLSETDRAMKEIDKIKIE